MELKRTLTLLLVLALVAALTVPAAAVEGGVLELGRISVMMPQITVELQGTGYAAADVAATLEAQELTVEGVAPYDPETDTTCVYVLVDLSTSMWRYFELVKTNIITFIEAMDSDDRLVLITFGEKTVDTYLSGSETKEEAIEAVKALQCDENGTLFYEALSRAYQMSTASTELFDREYVLAFSDGIDEQKGSTTFQEVLDRYESRCLPLYAACSGDTSQSGADIFGQIARTSGGGISLIRSEDDFQAFLEQINNVSLLRLRADSNHADGQPKQLTLRIGTLQAEYNVPILRSQPDQEPPQVTSLRYDAQRQALVIAYSEKVTGAAEAAAYKVIGPEGTAVRVSGVYYSESEDVYELRLDDTVWNGTYTVSFSGVTDASQQANPLTGEQTLRISEGTEPTEPEQTTQPVEADPVPKGQDMLLWVAVAVVVLLVLAGIIVAVVVAASRKREPEEEVSQASAVPPRQVQYEYGQGSADVVKHHIKSENQLRIHLRIVTGKTSQQNIETNLVNSLIIGRSDVCDIYIDDTKLSRQHFVLENDGGNLYVMDLQSRNGTMLNGTRINSRHPLRSGDRILAGLSEITITVTGR